MPSLQVRDLPEHIYRKIVELAEAERRSIAQETIILLEKALQIKAQDKKRRKQLLTHIMQEDRPSNKTNIPDPVPLIREDRQR
ncbi:MAG: hypothetical protein C4554_07005 [Dethiobacter sp.]|jgi:hypothetical protein|nr:MAG: hypothetical protein C4554_07005 [Dethiobacter sp.]